VIKYQGIYFMLQYFILLVVVGIPLMILEIGLGRRFSPFSPLLSLSVRDLNMTGIGFSGILAAALM
jgi:SNF family Na+-dependent transporter